MVLFRVGFVLLSLILLIACGDSSSRLLPSIHTHSYVMREASLLSSDGSLYIVLTDDDVNGLNRGQAFWVPVTRISTAINTQAEYTVVRVRGRRLGRGEVNLAEVYDAMIVVRTGRLKDQWDEFIAEQKERIYGPKDVHPPDVSVETR